MLNHVWLYNTIYETAPKSSCWLARNKVILIGSNISEMKCNEWGPISHNAGPQTSNGISRWWFKNKKWGKSGKSVNIFIYTHLFAGLARCWSCFFWSKYHFQPSEISTIVQPAPRTANNGRTCGHDRDRRTDTWPLFGAVVMMMDGYGRCTSHFFLRHRKKLCFYWFSFWSQELWWPSTRHPEWIGEGIFDTAKQREIKQKSYFNQQEQILAVYIHEPKSFAVLSWRYPHPIPEDWIHKYINTILYGKAFWIDSRWDHLNISSKNTFISPRILTPSGQSKTNGFLGSQRAAKGFPTGSPTVDRSRIVCNSWRSMRTRIFDESIVARVVAQKKTVES